MTKSDSFPGLCLAEAFDHEEKLLFTFSSFQNHVCPDDDP